MYCQSHSRWIIQILLCCIIIFCSCAPQIPVGKYELLEDSSCSILANTIDTYSRIERLQRRFAITTAPDSEINRDLFKPQIAGQSFDLTPELRFRESAFHVLVKYVTLLRVLSSKDYLSEVDKASQMLAGNLKNFTETSKMMKGSDPSRASGISATLANIIGRPLVKRKQLNALKEVMNLAQSDLEGLSELIVGSNKKIKTAVGIMLDRIIAHANAARPAYGTIERYRFDVEIADIITEVEEIEASLESMNTAILEIPNVHAQIRSEIEQKQTNLEALQVLIQEAQRASNFYRNLSN